MGDGHSGSLCGGRPTWVPYLVLVQLTVFILLLTLLLESDDDEAHEDVHHEEGDEDDVDDEEDGHIHAIVEDGAHVFFVRIDGPVQQPGQIKERNRQDEEESGWR